MKILLVIPTLKQGGAERVMSVLANIWVLQGHDVHLVLLAGGEKFYSLEDSVTVYNLGFVNNGSINKIMNELKTFIKLRNLLKQIDPDFVLSFMTKYNIFTILANTYLPFDVFVSDRANLLTRRSFIERLLKNITYKRARGIVAQTSFAKEILEKEVGHKNIKVIFNPLERVELQDTPKEKIILNVGRLIPEKGQKYLLDAFASIDNQEWKLVMLGDGPLYNDLENQAKSLGITKRLEMPGSVKNVDKWLSRSEIFVFTSLSEGFPNALAEAMGAGLACISFDCNAGPRDLISDTVNGYLVPVKDQKLLSLRLKELTESSEIRFNLGKQSETIKEKLDAEAIADEMLMFFKKSKGKDE